MNRWIAFAALAFPCWILLHAPEVGAQPPSAEGAETHAAAARAERRYASADSAYRVALGIHRQHGQPRGVALALAALGATALEARPLGDLGAPIADLTRALAIADSLRDLPLRSEILRDLAWAHSLSGGDQVAEARGRESVAAAVEAGDSTMIHHAASRLGQIYWSRGRFADAEPWFVRALERSSDLTSEVRAADLIWLARTRQYRNQLDAAEAGHREALDLARSLGSDELAGRALVGLGTVEERRGSVSGAIDRYAEAIALREASLDSHWEAPSPYEAMIHLCSRVAKANPDSNYAARGFMWAERGRAQATKQRLRALGAADAGPDSGSLLGLEDAQRLMSKKAAMLYYSVGDSSTSLWVLRRDRWRLFRLTPPRAWAGRVQWMRSSLNDPSRAGDRQALAASHQLYRALIQPVESILKGVNELVVVPDADLAKVPFEALLDYLAAEAGPTAGDYLVSRFAISYAPSATALGHAPNHAARGPLVAIGDTSMVQTWPKLANKRPVVTRTGAESSRSWLLTAPEFASASILQFGGQAVANDVEPARSGVGLAPEPGEQQPSFLSLADVVRLKLTASQVAFPACDAGAGSIDGAAGPIAFAAGFLESGSESVLISHWRVRGGSTQRLLERFYSLALKSGAKRSAALADAKRILLQDPEMRSPYFWAPIVLVGNAGPLD